MRALRLNKSRDLKLYERIEKSK